ncbi:MAG: asparagine synthase (glutamine-hydrolyzing), partial [Magnetospirillum sp.]
MCGIVGSFRPGGQAASTAVLAAMRDRMSHRGPDGAGLWHSPSEEAAFGHRRLAIIDLSEAAAQPMVNAEGTVALTFNGEIYNHSEIRAKLQSLDKYIWRTNHSDTEVLLHAYEEWGVDCIHHLIGMFAFAIWDGRRPGEPILHLVRDRMGKKPLYLTRTSQGEWLFASEIKALLAHPHISPEMDLTAFSHYLTFIVAPAPLTMFRGVWKLPAGWRCTIDGKGRARAEQWWDCRPSAEGMIRQQDMSFDEACGEVLRLLRQAVGRRMVSDVPFGVLLSGGVDSSLNVALMAEIMDRPVSTFTIGYDRYEDYNEFNFARRISQRYGTLHHESRISDTDAMAFLPQLVALQDEPIADNVCIPLYFLAQLVKESGTTVVQVGEGADENFLGYWWCEDYRRRWVDIYEPARRGARARWWRRLVAEALSRRRAGARDETTQRALAGQELFWGGAACWTGERRRSLIPDPSRLHQAVDCPVEGLLPDAFRSDDSHDVVRHYLAPLDGCLSDPEILQKIPYLEMKLRLPEHLLMRVDKMTMAHSIEARVPFLDQDVVDFATRLPPSYKLCDGIGKYLVKRAAEPLVDHDLLYRRKQGFGAPMDRWFAETDFGSRCLDFYDHSAFRKLGLIDDDNFRGLM